MGPVRRWLAQRETLIKRPKFFKDPHSIIGVRGIDAKLETMKDEKRKEWRARGYSEGLIDKAMDLAQEWAYKMSEVFTPPELREAAVIHNLPKGLEVADRWITALGDAVKKRG